MFYKGNQRRSQGNTESIWVLQNENSSDVREGSTGAPQYRRVWGGAYHNRAGMIRADSLGGRGLSKMRLNNLVLYDLFLREICETQNLVLTENSVTTTRHMKIMENAFLIMMQTPCLSQILIR